jgi:hypothetical protein
VTHAEPRAQLGRNERLGHEVVRAGVETLHDSVRVGVRGEQDMAAIRTRRARSA